MNTPYEGTCKGCGDWTLLFTGYCGECAPATAISDYIDWWNSPEGIYARTIMAEEALSEMALRTAEEHDQAERHQLPKDKLDPTFPG